MSTLLDNATIIKNNIAKFIVDSLSNELDSFSIEENEYQTGFLITCYYKTPRDKVYYISANYLCTSPHIEIKCNSNPGTIRDLYFFFGSEHENQQLHFIKNSISAVLDEFQVGSVHMRFNAEPIGEIYQDKKIKTKYCIHKEIYQGKIAFESHLNKFSFMNSRLKSQPYYYLDGLMLKSNKMISFIITGQKISLDLKNDESFNRRVDDMCSQIKTIILENSASTISTKFDIDDVSSFSDESIKDYLTLMTMETI